MARGRRDRYGRYKGKGGVKPWRNNNPGFYGKRPKSVRRGSGKHNATSGYRPKGIAPKKKSSTKKKVALTALAVGATAAGAYGIHKYRQKRTADALGTTGASVKQTVGKPKSVNKSLRLRPGTQSVTGGTPIVVPEVIKAPSKINAKSILTTTAAVAAAARAGTAVAEEDRSANESKSRWVRIEEARQAGIPAAATFIDSGGTDAQIREAQRKNGKKTSPTIKPSVVKQGPVHTEAKQAAEVQKRVSLSPPKGSFVTMKTPKDYNMVNQKGNAIRIFPQTRMNTRSSSIATRRQQEVALNKQYGRNPGAKASPRQLLKTPDTAGVKATKPATPKSSPAKKAAAPDVFARPDFRDDKGDRHSSLIKAATATQKNEGAAKFIAKKDAAALKGQKVKPPVTQAPKVKAKSFESMTQAEQNAFLIAGRDAKQKARPLGGAVAQQRYADFTVKHVSQARIPNGGRYEETFAAPEKRKPRAKRDS